MSQSLIFGLSSLTALLPLVIVSRRQEPQRDIAFWAAIIMSVAGPSTWLFVQMAESWQTNVSSALWVTVVACTFLFAVISLVSQSGWRLAPLFAPYMLLLAGLALIWQHETGQNLNLGNIASWVQIHIVMSVLTYALVTLGGISSLGAFIQEKALKTKKPTPVSRLLPSLTECETLMVRLLAIAAATLSIGLMTGVAIQYRESGEFFVMDHKTILSVTSFLVILGLLFAHYKSGLRGRRAARFVLVAYLLMTLGYPGLKFVTNVLIG